MGGGRGGRKSGSGFRPGRDETRHDRPKRDGIGHRPTATRDPRTSIGILTEGDSIALHLTLRIITAGAIVEAQESSWEQRGGSASKTPPVPMIRGGKTL
jgi:hypothetical protein